MSTLDHAVILELPPVEAVTNGKTNHPRKYTVAGMGPGVRAAYVRVNKETAWRTLDEQSARMSGGRYNRLEAAIMRDMAAGLYEWGGEIHVSQEDTKAGFVVELLARIRFGNGDESIHPTVTDELIERYGLTRLRALMNQADGPADPNGQTPAPEAATGGM